MNSNDELNLPQMGLDSNSQEEALTCDYGFKLLKVCSSLPKYSFNTYHTIPHSDGLFFLLEKGEKYFEYDRIVYVGINDINENIITKITELFTYDKDRIDLRKYLGASILNKKHNPYCRIWLKNSSNKKSLKKIGSFYDPELQLKIEEKVTNYLIENIQIVCLPILSLDKRIKLKERIINSLSECYEQLENDGSWIGTFVPDPLVRKSKIWNSNSVSKTLKLRDKDINDISLLVKLQYNDGESPNDNRGNVDTNISLNKKRSYNSESNLKDNTTFTEKDKEKFLTLGYFSSDDELFERLKPIDFINKIERINYSSSVKYLKYIKDLLLSPKIPQTNDEKVMLIMFYYYLYRDLPEEKGFENQSDFIEYLKNISQIYNNNDKLPFICENNIEKENDALNIVPILELHCRWTKSDILTALGYWNWESKIPVNEETLYIANNNIDILYIDMENSHNYLIDRNSLIWELPIKVRKESKSWIRYIKNDIEHHTIICMKNKDENHQRTYYYLGEARCIEYSSEYPLKIKWMLDHPLPSEIEAIYISNNIDSVIQESKDENNDIIDIFNYILENDKIQTPYKYTLFQSLVEICQSEASYVIVDDNNNAFIPIGLLVWKWMLYYYELLSPKKYIALMIGKINNSTSNRDLKIRDSYEDIIPYYRSHGGCEKLNQDIILGSAPSDIDVLLIKLSKDIRNIIILNSMKNFGGSLSPGEKYLIFHIDKKNKQEYYSFNNMRLSNMIKSFGYFYISKEFFDYLSGPGGKTILDDVKLNEKMITFVSSIDSNNNLTKEEIIMSLPKINI